MLRLNLNGILLALALSLGVWLAACSTDEPPEAQPQQQVATAESARQQVQEQAQAEQPVKQPEQPERADQPQPQAQAQQQQQAEDSVSQPTQAQEQEAQPEASDDAAQEQQIEADAQPAQQAAGQQAQASQAAVRSLEGVPGIVDPTNQGWPREVEGLNGVVSIPAKPMRIITASIGHDEMALALIPSERLVAVGAVSKDATFSNVDALVLDKPEISRDPESIIAQTPDVVVTSEFVSADVVDALQRAGIPVIQTALAHDLAGQINAILLFGYIFGEEERAFAFADEVENRYLALTEVTAARPDHPIVLSLTRYTDAIWTSGGDSTAGGVIEAAGGINAAAEAGIVGPQVTSLEGVIAMAPEIIVIPQPVAYGAEEFLQFLMEEEALAEVPAIRDGAVYLVESKHYGTLSFWNLRGAEALARILWPEDFPEPAPTGFSLPGGTE